MLSDPLKYRNVVRRISNKHNDFKGIKKPIFIAEKTFPKAERAIEKEMGIRAQGGS